MRTAAVMRLIAPLRPPVNPADPHPAMEPETTGLSADDILAFTKLDDNELISLGAYREINHRTILHRFAITTDVTFEEGSELKRNFDKNLAFMLANWSAQLDASDASKLTKRILANRCFAFTKPLLVAVRDAHLSYVSAGATLSVFEHPIEMATFLNAFPTNKSVFTALGLATPPKRIAGSAKSVVPANATPENGATLLQAELRLTHERHQHAMKEIDLLKQEAALGTKKLQSIEREHKSVSEALAGVQKQLATEQQAKEKTLMESAAQIESLTKEHAGNARILKQLRIGVRDLETALEEEKSKSNLKAAQITALIAERDELRQEVQKILVVAEVRRHLQLALTALQSVESVSELSVADVVKPTASGISVVPRSMFSENRKRHGEADLSVLSHDWSAHTLKTRILKQTPKRPKTTADDEKVDRVINVDTQPSIKF